MKLWEAMKALEEGKKVRKTYWKDKGYIMYDEHFNLVTGSGIDFCTDCLLSEETDWEIYEETLVNNTETEYMKLWEALKSLEEGKKIRHKTWSKGYYIRYVEHHVLIDENGDDYYCTDPVFRHLTGWEIHK